MEKNGNRKFGEYIAEMRAEKEVTMEQLCNGLCSASYMARIEQSNRQPDKLLQDRLLERLGVAPTDYENLLDRPEYDRWKKRQQLQRAIKERKWELANQRLQRYQQEYNMKNPLEKQYVLEIEAQIRSNTQGQEGLSEIYREAIDLTIPDYGQRGLGGQILSAYELNLILEYMRCSRNTNRKETIEGTIQEVITYVENSALDEISKAKLYPKAVVILWGTKRGDYDAYEELLKQCEKGIHILRDACRLYYLWELLSMRLELLITVDPFHSQQEKWRETKEWKTALENLYEENDIPVAMYESCYFREENEIYCISDVIRIRRNMLGMSRTELCREICDIKTLRRLEDKGVKTQRAIVKELLSRLKLPTVTYKTELQTDSPEARRLMRQLRDEATQYNAEKMEILMEQIKKRIPMDDPVNQQVMSRYGLLVGWMKGSITQKDYMQKLAETLEMTVPLSAALADGERYMTNEEIMCIQNIVLEKNPEDMFQRKCAIALKNFYKQIEAEESIDAYISMYEAVMCVVGSYLGNQERYDESDEIEQQILRESLLSRRVIVISDCLYNILWNDKEGRKKNIPHTKRRDIRHDLEQCIIWSGFIKDSYDGAFYKRKLEELQKM
jgi:transcriptional regulator with XRE-family HTH domain